MTLSTLTDRELTLLLGHSFYLGHALKTAARAEQRSRLKIPATSWHRGYIGDQGKIERGPYWSARWCGGRWAGGLDRLSESARLSMHTPKRADLSRGL